MLVMQLIQAITSVRIVAVRTLILYWLQQLLNNLQIASTAY